MSHLKPEEILSKRDRYVLHSTGWRKDKRVIIAEAHGAVLKDIHGKEYIDAEAGSAGPALIGYSHPKFVQRLKEEAEKLTHATLALDNVPLVEYCEKLAKILPDHMRKSYITTGGGLAIEAALKYVMRKTGKYGVISLYLCYHGHNLGVMNLLGVTTHRRLYPSLIGPYPVQQVPNAYCYRCPLKLEYPDCDIACANALESAIKFGSSGNVAAFILEAVQGPGGQIEFPKEYFPRIQKICDENDVAIIVDEIQTCLGRCGEWFACQLYDFKPDLLVGGKALGGGLPVCTVSVSDEFLYPELDEEETWHMTTFQNQPLLCAAGSAVIDIAVEEKFPDRARRLGSYLKKALIDLSKEHNIIGDVRGPGLFLGVELVKDRVTKEPAVEETEKAIYLALDKGLIIYPSASGLRNTIKIKPPLTITEEQIDRIIEILNDVFREIS